MSVCVPGTRYQDLDVEELLDVFQYDADYLESEAKYKEIKAEILVGFGRMRQPAACWLCKH